MTVEEFLDLELEGRAELEEGILYMMSGGSLSHAAISGNILTALRVRLRGSGCRPLGPDFAVRTGPNSVRLPDVSVYCGSFTREEGRSKLLGDPKVIVEVLSPSTRTLDQNVKLGEYRALEGVDAILFVDTEEQRVRLVERTGPEAWIDRWLPVGSDVELRTIAVTLPAAEIFDLA